eukprot:6655123-Heterocapsa_arctica.AAC.1
MGGLQPRLDSAGPQVEEGQAAAGTLQDCAGRGYSVRSVGEDLDLRREVIEAVATELHYVPQGRGGAGQAQR